MLLCCDGVSGQFGDKITGRWDNSEKIIQGWHESAKDCYVATPRFGLSEGSPCREKGI